MRFLQLASAALTLGLVGCSAMNTARPLKDGQHAVGLFSISESKMNMKPEREKTSAPSKDVPKAKSGKAGQSGPFGPFLSEVLSPEAKAMGKSNCQVCVG